MARKHKPVRKNFLANSSRFIVPPANKRPEEVFVIPAHLTAVHADAAGMRCYSAGRHGHVKVTTTTW